MNSVPPFFSVPPAVSDSPESPESPDSPDSPELRDTPLPLHGGNVWAAARQLSSASGLADEPAHGRTADHIHDFSTNTFARMAKHTSALMRQVLHAHALGASWLHYPDPDLHYWRTLLAQAEGLAPAHLVAGSGASELIWAALIALRPRRALFIGPLFSQYARACDALGIPWDVITPPEQAQGQGFHGAFAPDAHCLNLVRQSRQNGTDLVIVCSPNNPGTAVMTDPAPLLEALGSRTLLLDASYKDFLGTAPSARHSAHSHHWQSLHDCAMPGAHIVVLGSLTKFFCCPGIRLGWLAADEAITQRVEACRPAWTVPALAQEAGAALLAHAEAYRAALPALQNDVQALCSLLLETGLFSHIFPGVSFAIARLASPAHTRALQNFLLAQHILVRVCDNIPGMPPGYIRMQARPKDGQTLLAAALYKYATRVADTPKTVL